MKDIKEIIFGKEDKKVTDTLLATKIDKYEISTIYQSDYQEEDEDVFYEDVMYETVIYYNGELKHIALHNDVTSACNEHIKFLTEIKDKLLSKEE